MQSVKISNSRADIILFYYSGKLRLVGGKDSSAGDIYLGEKAVGCGEWAAAKINNEVICRELGFPGVLKRTYGSRFSKTYHQDNKILHKVFKCNGNEQKLEDCPQSDDNYCSGWIQGVICKTGEITLLKNGISGKNYDIFIKKQTMKQ